MYSDFIDESGDHGLRSIDHHYPVFVLCGVLVRKLDYAEQLGPRLCRLKMDFWGHDEIVLHEHDIRKPSGQFSILQIEETRLRFHQRVSELFEQCDFQLIYSLIRKQEYAARYPDPVNPYEGCRSSWSWCRSPPIHPACRLRTSLPARWGSRRFAPTSPIVLTT